MRVVVSDQKEVEEVKYPRLMIYKSGMIVIFNSSTKGMVVAGDKTYGVGDYSNNWDSTLFKDYIGEIKLSND